MPEVSTSVGKEDWIVRKWRPAMGWTYMVICIFDMIVFPVLWSFAQFVSSAAITQWAPLTLQGGGLFHLAMGGVLGVSAFSRGREKVVAMGSPQATDDKGN